MGGRRGVVAQRADAVAPFIVLDVLERAQAMEQAGREVLHLSAGEPSFPTPEPVLEAARRAIRDGHTHYTASLGLPALREAISDYYQRRYGVRVSPQQVVVTAGTSQAMALIALALLQAGDEAVVPDPGYPCYANFVSAADARPVRADATAGYLMAEAVEAALGPSTRMVVVNSPANPTGAVMPPGELQRLARLAEERGLWLVSDEIYHGLVYEGQEATALQFSSRALVVDGFSKRYAMTGWRLGWCVVPVELVRVLQKFQQNFLVSPPSVSQWAGLAALEHGEVYRQQMAREYDRRRLFLLSALPQAGLPLAVRPGGAFYAWVSTGPLGADSYRLAFDILERTGVALAPGVDFGPRGEGHLRVSYASSMEVLEQAVARLKEYVAAHGRRPTAAAASGAAG